MARRRFHATRTKGADRAIDRDAALRSLDADDLRAFVIETLDKLEEETRGSIEDALLLRAARGGYRPAAPPPELVGEVVDFAAAARRIGYAEPSEVDDYLRRGVTASLAGEQATARAVFEALLRPIAEAEIDLGQHEMVEEVLSVDLHDCVARYLVAVFLETATASRADAVFAAIENVHGLGVLVEPIRAMDQAFGRMLPDIDAFLGAWIARLESSPRHVGAWESEHERWLREAVARRDGTAGLARIARATKRHEAVRAWCDAVMKEGDWKNALATYEEAVTLSSSEVWRGGFLDGAALAASRLGRKDATKKLEAAWLGAPSLARLLRWLVADDASSALLRKRAAASLEARPARSSRLLAFLHFVTGDVSSAAKALKNAPGLGWSSSDHPGHLLFPVFAWMLGDETLGGVRAAVVEVLSLAPGSAFESALYPIDPATKLPTPTVLDVLERLDVRARLGPQERTTALDAMRAAASKRAYGVTGEKRRRHYDHAATLAACCVEVDRNRSAAWFEVLRAETSRFPAFQGALRSALDNRKMFAPLRIALDGE